MELTITKERILQAAEKCSTAKQTLKILFPEAFLDDVKMTFAIGDILHSNKEPRKKYLIAVDDNKFIKIVGLHSAYIWQDKRIKVADNRNISANDVRIIFPHKVLSEYTLERTGYLWDMITGQKLSQINIVEKF